MKKVLIITTSGGAGHLQAAKAKQQEIKKNEPETTIIQKELLLDWGWKTMGKLGINYYNKIQKTGTVSSKEMMVSLLTFADIIFWPKFFICMLFFLFKENIHRVIDTQPLGASSVIKAIRIYNRIKNKNLYLEKIIVDLPTKRSTNFFKNIKRLSKKDKRYLKIISFDPLLETEKTKEEFWQKNCNISEANVIYEQYIIRDAFKKYTNKKRDDLPFIIQPQINNQKDLITQILKKRDSFYKIGKGYFEFELTKDDHLTTILLGSQPAIKATIDYVKKYLECVGDLKDKNYYLFVFCADEKQIFDEIYNLVNSQDLSNITIVPLSYQTDEVVAPLFFRSDVTITKSGGSTIMELISVAQKKVLIHSDAKDGNLMKGIPYWEAGNALYLQDKIQSEIITPDLITSKIFL